MSYKKFKALLTEDFKDTDLPFAGQPKNIKKVKLPADLTALSDRQMGTYLTAFTTALDYSETVLAKTEIEYLYFSNKLEMLRAKFDISFTERLKGANKIVNRKISKCSQKLMYLEAQIKLYTTVFNRFERGYRVLSRELTRREKIIPGYKKRIN